LIPLGVTMAVFASTADPLALARRVTDAVKRGAVAKWELIAGHLRYADSRADGRVAFFAIIVTGSAVKFVLSPAKKASPLDVATYAYHHGRLTELLVGRFSDAVTRVQSTPFPGSMASLNE
jgi:hypothetical protein